jgi:hypothetical protein
MDQNWLSVAGIGIDLVGFLLLLREWWLAFFHESAALDFQQQRSFQQSMRHHQRASVSDQMRSHLDNFARMQDDMADRGARNRHIATLKSRKRAFRLATVLIIVGAVLQLVGALPPDVFQAAIRAG